MFCARFKLIPVGPQLFCIISCHTKIHTYPLLQSANWSCNGGLWMSFLTRLKFGEVNLKSVLVSLEQLLC